MNERMFLEISNILKYTTGDIIDFRVYKGGTFAYLVKLAMENGRHAVGMETFYGLEAPTLLDKNEDNLSVYPRGYAKATQELVTQSIKRVCGDTEAYSVHAGKLSDTLSTLPDRKYAFALVDLYHYHPTKDALEYIYDRMTPGGVIYFLNYHQKATGLASRAINEFIMEKEEDVFQFPDVIYNDNKLSVLRVACKQTLACPDSPISKLKESTKNVRNTNPVNIALVLRTGGDTYDHRYVNALARNIRDNVSIKYKLTVLTDNDSGFDSNLVDDTVKLAHTYPGWWSKIELFRPGLFDEQVFYLDLDTVIVRNIDDMLQFRPYFAGIRDLYHHNFLQTGIMTWNPHINTHIYDNFVPRAQRVILNYSEGDAKWIRENVYNYKYLSDKFPKQIVSYKAHCLNKDGNGVTVPKDASIICFHGRPRPHTITHSAITKHWKY